VVLGTLYWQVSLYLRACGTGTARAITGRLFRIRGIIYESVWCSVFKTILLYEVLYRFIGTEQNAIDNHGAGGCDTNSSVKMSLL